MEGISGLEVVLGGRLVIGPRESNGLRSAPMFPYVYSQSSGCPDSIHLLAAVDQTLLDGRNSFLLLDLLLDLRDLLSERMMVSHDYSWVRPAYPRFR